MNYDALLIEEQHHGNVDDLCVKLFDLFCERRRIVPLAYLMRGWPMPQVTALCISRLAEMLRELVVGHHDNLGTDEREIIRALLAFSGPV